ncbi:hypothetical protein Tco_0860868 [Tanacetum coccineum]|uniref:Uncharacterized protein n=1 Tax=Tanacetum coccineum TaxID=301880 RepID=A0ABQ5BGP3_9ASTR
MAVETQRQINHEMPLLARRLEEQEDECSKRSTVNMNLIHSSKIKCRSEFLAEKIQQEEREQFSVEERAKFLHDTIAAQRKRHAELKSKSFEEIQVLYERYKKQDQTFVAIGSEEDERAIKKMNEKDDDKEEEKKDESVHEEAQEEEGAKKRKYRHKEELKAKRRNHALVSQEKMRFEDMLHKIS